MNLYRGCLHNCVYCDGRTEKYNVDGEFGSDVAVKVNAIEVLRRELRSQRKHASSKPGFMMIGGGVGDSYQPVEKTYQITRKTLQLLMDEEFPVHVLTKSILVERDIDILHQINEKTRAIVSMSFSSVNEEISTIFEPGVPPPQDRLKTLALFKKEGFFTGMFLLPVIPFVTDTPEILKETIHQAKKARVDFIIFGGMTLKEGRQKEYFYRHLKKYYPTLLVEYDHIYRGDKWGNAINEYYVSLHETFYELSKQYKIPLRIPPSLYADLLTENDLIIVILEHIDYLLKLRGKPSPYGYAAYSISKIRQPLSTMKQSLRDIKGVGKITEQFIHEILETGSCEYYEQLLFG